MLADCSRSTSSETFKKCDDGKSENEYRDGRSDRQATNAPAQSPIANGGDIARRAYDLDLARGCDPGHDVEDWLQAERELQGVATPE